MAAYVNSFTHTYVYIYIYIIYKYIIHKQCIQIYIYIYNIVRACLLPRLEERRKLLRVQTEATTPFRIAVASRCI